MSAQELLLGQQRTFSHPPLRRTRSEGEEMTTPNHYERQIMQQLRGAGWVQAIALPSSPRTLAKLVSKGWIEKRDTSSGPAYRLTEAGLEAKKAPVTI